MKPSASNTDLIIAGGGPAGLYLGGLMLTKGFSVTILEKRKSIDLHSKALGIHPVSLELFEEAGIEKPFVSNGIKIYKGFAFIDRKKIGTINFEKDCPEPFNFILALPQHKTEEYLQNWVHSLNPDALIRGAEVIDFTESKNGVRVHAEYDGQKIELNCKYLIGCDGKESIVRKKSDIKYEGSKYPDTYIMGDFDDNTDFGKDAAVYLHRDGLIECFPLPGKKRRWVFKTDQFIDNLKRTDIELRAEKRLGHNLHGLENTMLSSFGVQHFMAESFHKGRILLAGDSAHVVSPIGGQGMNLGWINGKRLTSFLESALNNPEERDQLFKKYTFEGKKFASQIARRAEQNMWLGRKRSVPVFRNILARAIVQTPVSKIAARKFTMR